MRGVGACISLIVCDEFLFFHLDVLPVILPTLATGSMFIMISSVAPDGDSPLRKIIDTKYADGVCQFFFLFTTDKRVL